MNYSKASDKALGRRVRFVGRIINKIKPLLKRLPRAKGAGILGRRRPGAGIKNTNKKVRTSISNTIKAIIAALEKYKKGLNEIIEQRNARRGMEEELKTVKLEAKRETEDEGLRRLEEERREREEEARLRREEREREKEERREEARQRKEEREREERERREKERLRREEREREKEEERRRLEEEEIEEPYVSRKKQKLLNKIKGYLDDEEFIGRARKRFRGKRDLRTVERSLDFSESQRAMASEEELKEIIGILERFDKELELEEVPEEEYELEEEEPEEPRKPVVTKSKQKLIDDIQYHLDNKKFIKGARDEFGKRRDWKRVEGYIKLSDRKHAALSHKNLSRILKILNKFYAELVKYKPWKLEEEEFELEEAEKEPEEVEEEEPEEPKKPVVSKAKQKLIDDINKYLDNKIIVTAFRSKFGKKHDWKAVESYIDLEEEERVRKTTWWLKRILGKLKKFSAEFEEEFEEKPEELEEEPEEEVAEKYIIRDIKGFLKDKPFMREAEKLGRKTNFKYDWVTVKQYIYRSEADLAKLTMKRLLQIIDILNHFEGTLIKQKKIKRRRLRVEPDEEAVFG
jgi:hypothetical protein